MLVTSILSIPIEISPKVETTLQDEISMLICGKIQQPYIYTKRRNKQKCIEVVRNLIRNGLESTVNNLTSNPTEGLKKFLKKH